MITERKTKSDTRYFSLDFWRGAACLMIVVYHSSPDVGSARVADSGSALGAMSLLLLKIFDHFAAGVPIFFVISGYCITAACDPVNVRRRSFGEYFRRRFHRIFPPYWIAALLMLGLMAFPMLFGRPELFSGHVLTHPLSSFSGWNWIGNIFLAEGIRPHLAGPPSNYFLGQAWTLCYEEQFYIVTGILFLVGNGRHFKNAGWFTLAVLLFFLLLNIHPLPVNGFFFDGHWLQFAMGMLVYYGLHYASPHLKKLIEFGLLAGCAATVVWQLSGRGVTKLQTGLENPFRPEDYCVAFFFAFLISILHRWDQKIITNRWLRPISYCGIMCYSLYLTHMMVVKTAAHILDSNGGRSPVFSVFVIIPVCLVLAVTVGWTFFLLVERKFLNRPPVFPWTISPSTNPSPPASTALAGTMALPPGFLMPGETLGLNQTNILNDEGPKP